METYFSVKYDNEASGPFVADETKVTWDAAASEGHIVSVFDDGTTGILVMALITGSIPDDSDTMTGNYSTQPISGRTHRYQLQEQWPGRVQPWELPTAFIMTDPQMPRMWARF